MLDVARSATYRMNNFVGMMCRCVVAFVTGVINNFGAEKTERSYMADVTLLPQNSVCCRKRPTAVDLLAVGTLEHEPSNGHDRNQNGEP